MTAIRRRRDRLDSETPATRHQARARVLGSTLLAFGLLLGSLAMVQPAKAGSWNSGYGQHHASPHVKIHRGSGFHQPVIVKKIDRHGNAVFVKKSHGKKGYGKKGFFKKGHVKKRFVKRGARHHSFQRRHFRKKHGFGHGRRFGHNRGFFYKG